jgi:hypothetical protein
MALTASPQNGLNARSTIGLAALPMNAPDLPFEALILLRAWARGILSLPPIIVAAGGDFKRLTKRGDGMFAFQCGNPLEALFGGSERMPKVFFKMSRC